MTDVYIVCSFGYESYEILGVFSTRAAAEAAMQATEHRRVEVVCFPVLTTPNQLDICIRATVEHSWLQNDPQRYNHYRGWLGRPFLHTDEPLDVVEFLDLGVGDYGVDTWVVASRTVSGALAALRTALGDRWTSQLEEDFLEDANFGNTSE